MAVTAEVAQAKKRKVGAAEAKRQRRKDKAATKEQARLILLGQAELPKGVKVRLAAGAPAWLCCRRLGVPAEAPRAGCRSPRPSRRWTGTGSQ